MCFSPFSVNLNISVTIQLGFYQRAGKVVEHEDDGDINGSWSTWNSLQRPERRN